MFKKSESHSQIVISRVTLCDGSSIEHHLKRIEVLVRIDSSAFAGKVLAGKFRMSSDGWDTIFVTERIERIRNAPTHYLNFVIRCISCETLASQIDGLELKFAPDDIPHEKWFTIEKNKTENQCVIDGVYDCRCSNEYTIDGPDWTSSVRRLFFVGRKLKDL